MVIDKRNKKHICPICKKEYIGFPALSRVDNKTKICSRCGQNQALKALEKFLNKKGITKNGD